MAREIRILLLADSHLGFDLPVRPRVERRRRGHDFLANYATALEPALRGEVDLVIHGGDVFDRPRAIPTLAYQAFDPLRRIADLGVPVFLVPGNHERSYLPHLRFAAHPLVHVFDRPRTCVTEIRGARIAIAGLPYERRDVRTRFPALVEATGWREERADHFLLLAHHCIEGATVGPANYTFTTAADVIRARDVPPGFTALLSGHIHRHQVLSRDLGGRALDVPILYPGSIERTALAEIGEPKGFLIITLDPDRPGPAGLGWAFRPLPARPMLRHDVVADGLSPAQLDAAIREIVAGAPSDAVLALRLSGELGPAHRRVLSARRLRTFVPATMNLELMAGPRPWFERRRGPRAPAELPPLELPLG
jgi:exonuclease SbcD